MILINFSIVAAIHLSNIQESLQSLLKWIQDFGSASAAIFIGTYLLLTVLLIPGSVLTLGAGVVFGAIWGSLYAFIGATLGATAAFLIGRYFARDWISKKIEGNAKFKAIDETVAKEGLKIVFLTRLSPAFPFVLLNYAFSVTDVSLRDYVLGCTGMIPGTILYVYIGSLAGSLATIDASAPSAQSAQLALRSVGLIATVAVTLYLTRIARKALASEDD
ncbi:TVP38/TMEM64 family protein [Phormidesmis priestleyi ULC007]|uniref:TVP38/TMEM64 family membrane protein n=1 Tax=Phormidesmis priestleyi ULC007 TaxID=1920490 RepID=A0A2T1D3Q1_9CYAN|nr:TVP38/TMEM64 family protein [Phormidesmis priestleyi]PSB15108.1 TVP38/TMEM64 family protein [Phormidesmis priestleyi ULC007]PZO45994.1 MAG: TVP38/TMEM64 family protein [Phormidesmis priestleyi]